MDLEATLLHILHFCVAGQEAQPTSDAVADLELFAFNAEDATQEGSDDSSSGMGTRPYLNRDVWGPELRSDSSGPSVRFRRPRGTTHKRRGRRLGISTFNEEETRQEKYQEGGDNSSSI